MTTTTGCSRPCQPSTTSDWISGWCCACTSTAYSSPRASPGVSTRTSSTRPKSWGGTSCPATKSSATSLVRTRRPSATTTTGSARNSNTSRPELSIQTLSDLHLQLNFLIEFLKRGRSGPGIKLSSGSANGRAVHRLDLISLKIFFWIFTKKSPAHIFKLVPNQEAPMT